MENQINVRLTSYKSFRHYGGREIKSTTHICKATLIKTQTGHQPYIVELMESCAGFPKGHKIAITERNYNVSITELLKK